MKHTNAIAPRCMLAWWELDNVYNFYSELRQLAFQMKIRLSTGGTNSSPKEGCEALWNGAEDLECHWLEQMYKRRDELNADRDCIIPISDCKLLQLQLEECGVQTRAH